MAGNSGVRTLRGRVCQRANSSVVRRVSANFGAAHPWPGRRRITAVVRVFRRDPERTQREGTAARNVAVRPRCGNDCCGKARESLRSRLGSYLRYGWHQRGHWCHARRRSRAHYQCLHRRCAGDDAGRGGVKHRGRRWLDHLGRCRRNHQSRPGKRRCSSGARLLWPGRGETHHNRLLRHARLHQPERTLGRQDEARQLCGGRGAERDSITAQTRVSRTCCMGCHKDYDRTDGVRALHADGDEGSSAVSADAHALWRRGADAFGDARTGSGTPRRCGSARRGNFLRAWCGNGRCSA